MEQPCGRQGPSVDSFDSTLPLKSFRHDQAPLFEVVIVSHFPAKQLSASWLAHSRQ